MKFLPEFAEFNEARLGDAEYEVMAVLWKEAPLTSSQVIERVPIEKGWRPSTVKTMLGRLLAKGFLSHRQVGRQYLYSASLTREQYAADQCELLLSRFFDGNAQALVDHLVASGRLQKGSSGLDVEQPPG